MLLSFFFKIPGEGSGSSSVMSVVGGTAVVKKEQLWDVVGTDQWEINNSLDKKYKPHRAKHIVRDANAQVGREVDDSILFWNCEHFVKNLRFGKVESRQVSEQTLVKK